MSKFKKMARKATSIFVSLTTTIWLAGFGALVPIAAQAQTTAELQAQIQELLALVASLQVQLAALEGGGGGGVSCTFTRDLYSGVTGDDVKCLQQYLNSAGYTVATSGAGSVGNETTYFGSRTGAAVAKWQDANKTNVLTPIGLAAGTGYWGAKSRTHYSTLIVAAPAPTPTPTPEDGTPAPVGTGLTVMAGEHPAETLAPQSAVHIPFTTVKFTASSDGDVTVNSITVERQGLAADAAFAGAVLLDEDMTPITAVPKAFNSDHQAVLTEDFVVKAGQTKTMYIAGNMLTTSLSSYAGQVAYIALKAVNTSAQVNGTLPIAGTGHTINASLGIGSITLTRGASDPGDVGPTKEVGTKAYIFTSIKATVGSAEAVKVTSIRWNQSGSAAKGDLENVKVVHAETSTEYMAEASSDGKYYKAVFDPAISVKKGGSAEIYIKGDVISGSNRTVDMDLYRYDDFVFEGQSYGYKISPTATETTADNDDDAQFQDSEPRFDADQITIGVGTIRVEKDNLIAAGNIANGTTGAALGAFLFDITGEAVSYTSWTMTVTSTNSDSGTGEDMRITNMTVYDKNGTAVAGPLDLSRGVTTLTFTDSVSVPVGKNIYTVKGDLNANWENNDTIQLSFTPSTGLGSVKGDVTGTTITPTPAAAVNANKQTLKAGALALSKASTFSNQTYIEGSNGVELGRYVLDATDSGEDVKVTVAKIRAQVTTGDLDNYQNLQLFDGTTALTTGTNVVNPSGNSADTAATLTFTINAPGLIVPKGTTKVIALKGNLTTGHTDSDFARFNYVSLANTDWNVSGVDTTQDVVETFSTTTNAKITIRTSGGWSVAAAPSQPTEKWYAAGGTGVTLNVLRFTSTTEEFALTNLRLQIDVTGSSSGSDFAKVHLYNGATLLQTKNSPAFNSGVEDFTFPESGTGSFVIPKDGSSELTIKADLASIGTNLAGKAGQLVGIDFDAATSKKNLALGSSSGDSLHTSSTSDVTGNGIVYFRSVPTIARVAIPQTTLTSGNHVLYKFTVAADPAYDVALYKATFSVATTGITAMASALPSFTLWNTTDNKRVAAATGSNANMFTDNNGNFNSSGQLIVRIYADTTDYTNAWVPIPKGTTHTFELRSDITTDGSADSVSTKLLGDDARSPRLTLTGSSAQVMQQRDIIDNDLRTLKTGVGWVEGSSVASSSSFIWTDYSSDATTTHSANTADWMNGFKIPGLLSTGLDASTLSN